MPEPYTDDIDTLLAKQLAGEATPEEKTTVTAWLAESAEHAQYFAQLEQLWEDADPPELVQQVDIEAALTKVKAQLNPLQAVRGGRRKIEWLLASAAAVAALLLVVLFFVLPRSQSVELAATDAVRSDTLTDGSVVALNRASSLTVAADFGRRERRMRLRGAGHFAVAPDREKPFVVEVQQLEVRVVGTEFTVDDRRQPGEVVVSVVSGVVELRSAAQTERLQAGEQASYEVATGRILRATQPDPNADAWRSRRFAFEATPLGEVVRQLETVYGVTITLQNPALARCPLTARYAGLEPERILELIADTFSLTLRRTAGQFVLDGPGCGEE